MEPNLARAGPSTYAHTLSLSFSYGTVLVPGQLVSQTPNGAMHHRASEARSLYVMMHGRKKLEGWRGKLCHQPRISGETSLGDLAQRTPRLLPQSAVLCCAMLHVDCVLFVPRVGSGAERPALT